MKSKRREAGRRRRDRAGKSSTAVRNIMIAAVAVVIVGAVIAYNYSAEQTKQKGLKFGMDLEEIQNEIKTLQTGFYSERAKWEEGDIERKDLLEFYDRHVESFEDAIDTYDALEPPELFEGAVELLRLSSQAQLDSDLEYIKWIRDGDEAAKARSDALLQDALEYELLGLVEFYSAKTGVKAYDDTGEMFEAPQRGIAQKVDMVADHMIAECNERFGPGTGEEEEGERTDTASGAVGQEWAACIAEAEEWRSSHMS